MVLEKLYYRFRGVSSTHVLQNGRCIYSERDFAKLVSRERARVDRGGKGFSIAIFHLENSEQNSDLYRGLIKLMSRRIRITDEIGWVDKKSIGVLLVEVVVRDALKLASEIRETAHFASAAIEYRVLNYPSGVFTDTGSRSKPSGRSFKKLSPAQSQVDQILHDNPFKNGERIHNTAFESVDPFFANGLPLWKRTIDILCSAGGILVP